MTRMRFAALLITIIFLTGTTANAVYSGIAAKPGDAETRTYEAPEESEVFSYADVPEIIEELPEEPETLEEIEKTENITEEPPDTEEESEEDEGSEKEPEEEPEKPAEPVEVTEVAFDLAEVTVKTNETVPLNARCLPSNASDTSIIWFTSNSEVAEVSDNGEVTGIMEGTAVITAMSAASPWIFETCNITVEKDFLSSILLGRKSVKLSVGSVMPVAVITAPDTAYDKTFTWTSDNEDVAEMLPGNVIRALKPGTVSFTAAANEFEEGGRPAEARIFVTVITTADYYCTVDKSITFKASIITEFPENLIWNIYKLTKDSCVDAGPGEVELITNNLTCKFFGRVVGEYRIEILDPEDEKNTQIIHVNVKEPVKRVIAYMEGDEENKKKRRAELTLNQDGTNPKTVQLYAAVEPESATYKDVYWKSSKPKVAIVDENGKVTPLSAGSSVISCTSAADGKKSTFSVIVKYNPSMLTLNKTEPLTLGIGDTVKLKAKVDKFKNSSSVIVWESSNPEAVMVNNGNVTAVGVGTATVTASSTGGNVSASIEIKAAVTPSKVVAENGKLKLTVGETVLASVRLEPSGASDTELAYTSRNDAVAKVDDKGVITAIGKGTTTVTVMAVNGKKANISVVVK